MCIPSFWKSLPLWSFPCIGVRIGADASILSRSAHRTQTRGAECWAKHRVCMICQSLPSNLVSQINRRKAERWSDRSKSHSRSLWEQWDQNRGFLSPGIASLAASLGYFMKEIYRLWGFNYFFVVVAFPLLPLHVTSGSCGSGYCQSSK